MNERRVRSIGQSSDAGYALIATMMLLALLASLYTAYFTVTHTELALVKASKDSQSGFNAAEAGLNLRGEEIRSIFEDYGKPDGVSPDGIIGCDAGQLGEGDYRCQTYSFSNGQNAVTYVSEDQQNPYSIVIPQGEAFQGLNALEYRYTATSVGRNLTGSNEAILELTFLSRLVPLFQFAIFFEEDLEFFNGASMTVDGHVHTNGDMYIGTQSGGTTNYTGQVTVASNLYRGQKSQASCSGYQGTARISDVASNTNPNFITLPSCSASRFEINDVSNWNENVMLGVEPVDVPRPEDMDSFSDGDYWQRADIRLVLRLDGDGAPVLDNSPTGIEVVGTDGLIDTAATAALHDMSCSGQIDEGGVNYSVGNRGPSDPQKLRLFREYQSNSILNGYEVTLEVDLQNLLNCMYQHPEILAGKTLDDDTEDGLVFYFALDGPESGASHNNYGVRIRNGAELQSSLSGAPLVKGLTVVSDQKIIVWGDYNSIGWVPAALMGDTLWLLSNDWNDSDSEQLSVYQRDGNATQVYAAVISGMRRTGNANGEAGQNFGANSNGGGVINIFRFNEWFREGTSIPDFTYVGSLVSLGPPRHSTSTWGPFTYYSAPNRNWSYEVRFNDPDLLPPMTPTFVYLRQELFVRDYELY